MGWEFIDVRKEGAIAVLQVTRPKLNPLSSAVLAEMGSALVDLHHDPDVRALVVTGAGDRAFVAGADIKEMAGMSEADAWAFSRAGSAAIDLLENAPFATIAAVNGFALGGGCELALACDIIYASDTAMFGQPEVNLGVIPGFGGTQRLARVVGTMLARELVLTGRMVDATEALRIGLVAQVFPSAEMQSRVREIATMIATKGPLAVQAAKRCIRTGFDLPLATATRLEREEFAALFSSRDQKEGMTAFIEKRDPLFHGN